MDTKLVRGWCFRVFCIVYICICTWVCICILCSSKRVGGHKACQRAVFASLALPTLKLVPLLSPPTRNTEHHIEQGSTNSTDINHYGGSKRSTKYQSCPSQVTLCRIVVCNGRYRDAEELKRIVYSNLVSIIQRPFLIYAFLITG